VLQIFYWKSWRGLAGEEFSQPLTLISSGKARRIFQWSMNDANEIHGSHSDAGQSKY
jgi:hypothetical protein